jgi:hypothetical protein
MASAGLEEECSSNERKVNMVYAATPGVCALTAAVDHDPNRVVLSHA